jgi:hypothetical protein
MLTLRKSLSYSYQYLILVHDGEMRIANKTIGLSSSLPAGLAASPLLSEKLAGS